MPEITDAVALEWNLPDTAEVRRAFAAGSHAALCWAARHPDGLTACDRAVNHAGRHSWESSTRRLCEVVQPRGEAFCDRAHRHGGLHSWDMDLAVDLLAVARLSDDPSLAASWAQRRRRLLDRARAAGHA